MKQAPITTPLRSLALFSGAVMASQAFLALAGGADFVEVLKLFLIAASFIFVPFAWTARFPEETEGREFAVASLVYWVAMTAAGFYLPEGWPSWLGLAFISAASIAGAARAIRSLAGRRPGPVELTAWGALVLYCCGTWWSTGHAHPDIEAHIARAALHVDYLYITALSSLIRGFGRVSLGHDGLAPLQWHFLTAGILAAAGKLAGVRQIAVHANFYPMFGPTLYALGLAAFAERFRRAPAAVLTLIVVCLAGWLLPKSILGVNAAWDPIGSETFAAGLALFFIGALRQPLERQTTARNPLDLFLDLAWVLALTFAKVSVGFLAAGWLTMQRVHDNRLRRRDIGELGVLWATFLACLPVIMGQTSKATFKPLWFVLAQIGLPSKWPVFFLVHWLPLWIGIGALALRRRDWFTALRADRYFMTLIVPAWIVGVATFNFTIRGGSSVYFSMLAPIFAIPWTTAHLLEAARAKPRAGRALLVAVVVLAAAFQMWPNARGLWNHIVLRRIDLSKSPESSRFVESIAALKPKLSTSPRCGLYVSNRALVESPLNKDIRCFEIPFYYTAILERPLIMSWMPYGCRTDYAGFWWGHSQSRDQPPEMPTDMQLCSEARRSGLGCVEKALGGEFELLACP